MAELFAVQIINGEITGASDLAGRTSRSVFVEPVLILCLVAKEQFSALCLPCEKVHGSDPEAHILSIQRARFGERRLRPKRRGLKTVRGRHCDNEPF